MFKITSTVPPWEIIEFNLKIKDIQINNTEAIELFEYSSKNRVTLHEISGLTEIFTSALPDSHVSRFDCINL